MTFHEVAPTFASQPLPGSIDCVPYRRGARRELPSDGIMILFNNEHNRFMVRMLSPFFHESTRGFGVVLVVLVVLSISLSAMSG